MKKKLIIIFSIILVLVLAIVLVIKIVNNSKINTIIGDVKEDINDKVNNFDKHFNLYKYTNQGNLNINAKYKGAHGEAYPANYDFSFELNNDKLIIGNEEGYSELTIDEKLIKIINKLMSINKATFIKEKEIEKHYDEIVVYLDEELINTKFNTNFQNVFVKISISGLIKKLNHYTVCLDDLVIRVNDNNINIKQGKNEAKVILNNRGYSLVLNEKVKMNVIYEKQKTQYNIVIDGKVIMIEIKENEIYSVLSSDAAIYHGLELTYTFKEANVNKNNKFGSINDVPLIRYRTNIDYSFWR